MNDPTDDGASNLRYAEYVLGVLDADARADVAREIRESDEAAVAVAIWQRRLTPLAEEIAAQQPPDQVWTRIRTALGLDVSAAVPGDVPASRQSRPQGLWNSLRFWQWLSVGAGSVALACAVLLSQRLAVAPVPVVPSTAMLASAITQTGGQVAWTAAMDVDNARLLIVPAAPPTLDTGLTAELWLIPEGQAPISVGVFAADAATTLTLSPALLARIGPSAKLAVSLEPAGGSPTGQPTGPVIGVGTIGAASARLGAPVPLA